LSRRTRHLLRHDSEFIARALLKWITEQGIEAALIDPGKSWQNGVSESFNGKSATND
jgi:transposase InsO family protein